MFVGHLAAALAGGAIARRRRWPIGLALWLLPAWAARADAGHGHDHGHH